MTLVHYKCQMSLIWIIIHILSDTKSLKSTSAKKIQVKCPKKVMLSHVHDVLSNISIESAKINVEINSIIKKHKVKSNKCRMKLHIWLKNKIKCLKNKLAMKYLSFQKSNKFLRWLTMSINSTNLIVIFLNTSNKNNFFAWMMELKKAILRMISMN